MRIPSAPLLCLLSVACSAVEITPRALREHRADPAGREEALESWASAVSLANRFLASPERRTLPPGQILLREDGMHFAWQGRSGLEEETGVLRTFQGEIPLTVWVSGWGGLVNAAGYQAQEREGGFVVGRVDGWKDALVDNSFFKTLEGEWLAIEGQASLLLHEATHVYYEEGTVGFWNSVGYYAEAAFLLRSSTHSAETLPGATDSEFTAFLGTQAARAREGAPAP